MRGSVESLTNTFMSVIRMPAGGRLKFDDLSGRKIFLYVVFGSVTVEGEPVTRFNIAELHDDGDALELTATNTSIVLFGYAETIDEPIAARGPFVSTRRESSIRPQRIFTRAYSTYRLRSRLRAKGNALCLSPHRHARLPCC